MADVAVTEQGIVVAGVLAMTWKEVDEQRNLFRFKDHVLVKVGFSYSRGDWYDHWLVERSKWLDIKEVLTGRTAWYLDFAGKHSETSVTFWENIKLQEINDLQEIVDFHQVNGFSDSNLEIIYGALEYLQDEGEIEQRDGFYYACDKNN